MCLHVGGCSAEKSTELYLGYLANELMEMQKGRGSNVITEIKASLWLNTKVLPKLKELYVTQTTAEDDAAGDVLKGDAAVEYDYKHLSTIKDFSLSEDRAAQMFAKMKVFFWMLTEVQQQTLDQFESKAEAQALEGVDLAPSTISQSLLHCICFVLPHFPSAHSRLF